MNGINDLINTLPITLITQNQKIKQVTIINNINQIKTVYVPNMEGKEKKNDITQSSVKVVYLNNKNFDYSLEYYFLSYLKVDKKKEKLRLIAEIIKEEGQISLMKKTSTIQCYIEIFL